MCHNIMMNVFGGARSRGGKGPRGPRGFPGKDSSINDFCTWLPNTILKQLEEHEEVCYILSRKNPENARSTREMAHMNHMH